MGGIMPPQKKKMKSEGRVPPFAALQHWDFLWHPARGGRISGPQSQCHFKMSRTWRKGSAWEGGWKGGGGGWRAGREGCVNIRNGQATTGVEGRSGNRADIPGATTPRTPWGGKTRRGSSVAEHRWWQGHNLALRVAAAAARRVGTPLPPSCGPGPRIGAGGLGPRWAVGSTMPPKLSTASGS